MNFALIQHHKWSLTEIEGMIPWERDLYIGLLAAHVKVEAEKARDEAALRRAQLSRK